MNTTQRILWIKAKNFLAHEGVMALGVVCVIVSLYAIAEG